jgi:hypothetical protein
MQKLLAALTILGTMSVPAVAQTSQTAPAATNPSQAAKPQTVKKRVCEVTEEDSYSRLGGRKTCKTIEVPVDQAGQDPQKAPTNSTPGEGKR